MTAPTGRIRLLLVLEDLDFGGTQRYVTHFLRHLDRDRFEAELWTMRGGTDFEADIRAAGIPLRHLSRAGYVWPPALLRLLVGLVRHRPDVLYTLTGIPDIWGRLFGAVLHIPVVSSYRNVNPNLRDRVLWRLSRRIIANSERGKRLLVEALGVAPERVSVVPNGVDTEHFTPVDVPSDAPPLVLCLARRAKAKDLPTLISAFEHARSSYPDARLQILGNGSEPLDPGPNVEILPGAADVRPHLASASVFAMASIAEGQPNAILEAMAAGLPIVATRVGGVPELVADGNNGFLVSPRRPEALGEALARLFGDADLRRTMGAASRRRAVDEFSIPLMVRRTEDVLIAAADPPHPLAAPPRGS